MNFLQFQTDKAKSLSQIRQTEMSTLMKNDMSFWRENSNEVEISPKIFDF